MKDNIFAMRTRELIKSRMLNLNDLADKVGVTPKTIYTFMNGTRVPSFDNLVKLSEHLGVSTDYLLGKSDVATGIILTDEEKEYGGEILYIRRAYIEMDDKEREIILRLITGIYENKDDKRSKENKNED